MSEQARLLPWAGPAGQRAYLETDDPNGFLSVYADGVEETQLATGATVLEHVRRMLREPVPAGEWRYAAERLAECLADALRVAESRGARLPVAEDD